MGVKTFANEGGLTTAKFNETDTGADLSFHIDVVRTPWWLDVEVIQTADGIHVTSRNPGERYEQEWWYVDFQDFISDQAGAGPMVRRLLRGYGQMPDAPEVSEILGLFGSVTERNRLECLDLVRRVDSAGWRERQAIADQLSSPVYVAVMLDLRGDFSPEQWRAIDVALGDWNVSVPESFIRIWARAILKPGKSTAPSQHDTPLPRR